MSLDPQYYMAAETTELNTKLYPPHKKMYWHSSKKSIIITDSIMSEGKAMVLYWVLSPLILSTLQLLLPLFFDLFLIKFVTKKSPKRKAPSSLLPVVFPTQVIDHIGLMVT